MEKLTQLIQTLWSENKLSKETYYELLNFTNETQALQLQQTGVISSACNDYVEGINMQCPRCDEPKYKHKF